jgi:hypothetical protein
MGIYLFLILGDTKIADETTSSSPPLEEVKFEASEAPPVEKEEDEESAEEAEAEAVPSVVVEEIEPRLKEEAEAPTVLTEAIIEPLTARQDGERSWKKRPLSGNLVKRGFQRIISGCCLLIMNVPQQI